MDLETYLWKNRIEMKDFAAKVGCHCSYISMIVRNKRLPSIKLAKKIEKATNGKVKAKEIIKAKIKNLLRQSFEESMSETFSDCVKKEIE